MNPWKIVAGTFFIAVGVLFFIFLRELNDPEIEGKSGEISLGEYFICLIPITIGVIIIFYRQITKDQSK